MACNINFLTFFLLSICSLFLETIAQDCQYVGYENKPCPRGFNEVYRDQGPGPTYVRMCCKPGSEGETNQKRSAPNCRATKCLASTGGNTCSTLDARYINNERLVYEEVMQDPCTRGNSQGVVGLCCRPNSTEGVLVSILGAEHNEFPHQVKVKPVDCGGTIYNSRYIITAAHCVVDGGGNVMNASNFKAIVGTNIGDMDLNAKEYAYQVKRIIPHEEYSRLASNPNNELAEENPRILNDVALLELEEDLKFSHTIKALEIAPEGFNPFDHGDNAIIAGWGTTETLALAIHLQKANFILRQDRRCFGRRGRYAGSYGDYGNQLLCVGGILDGQFSWTAGGGDSGGPAVCRKADGHPVLCGVTSFGGDDDACAKNSDSESCWPSVYAEVAHFRSWIIDNAGEQDEETFYRPYLYGKEVSKGQYEHQVHITSAGGKPCGGTLIAPDVVVTAAQCVMAPGGKESYPDLKVTAGISNLKGQEGKQFRVKDARFLGGFAMEGKPVDIQKQGDRVFLTDNYYKNDLAVVKLDGKASNAKKFPRLPVQRETFYEGMELAFPRNTTRSGMMRFREFNILDELDCQKRMDRIGGKAKINLKVDNNILCGIEKYSGGSTCDRELGGGLICKGSDGADVLCGVQSFRMCMLSIPNGFVNMALYGGWVNKAAKQMKTR